MSSKDVYIVHHIAGYNGEEKYKVNEKLFTEMGFIRCRSDKDSDGKLWEIWMVMPWMLNGDLKNAKQNAIVSWITQRAVGNIDICKVETSWGLGID